MNHRDALVSDWGPWNRSYSRLLIRARGYRLVSMLKALRVVDTVGELSAQKTGGLLWLKPRKSFYGLNPPTVSLGRSVDYILSYFRSEFFPRENRPWIAFFRDPLVYGRQYTILDLHRRAFEESIRLDRRWRAGVPRREQKVEEKARPVPGTYLMACLEFHSQYAHHFIDLIPRLMLFDEAGLLDRFPALLPETTSAFAEESFRHLGLDGPDSLRWDNTCWRLDGLYFAPLSKMFCSWTPETALWVRKKYNPLLEEKPVGKKIFYITRRKGNRPILNEDDILAKLAPYDVTVVETETLSLQEQIDLFADARMIIGPQGAGIQNALWAPRGCAILELLNARYFSGVFWTLAESVGQKYGFVAGESAKEQDPLTVGYTCDPELVDQALHVLLKR
jgi:hypothetical protein